MEDAGAGGGGRNAKDVESMIDPDSNGKTILVKELYKARLHCVKQPCEKNKTNRTWRCTGHDRSHISSKTAGTCKAVTDTWLFCDKESIWMR